MLDRQEPAKDELLSPSVLMSGKPIINDLSATTSSLGLLLAQDLKEKASCQGDPLAPYLFVLCMEVLGQDIRAAVDSKQWKAIKLSRSGPPISHLFFADDLILFGEARNSQAYVMENILKAFYLWPEGQCG